MYNMKGNVHTKVTWRRFRVTIVPWKSNTYLIFWVCVCSHSYPTCNMQAP